MTKAAALALALFASGCAAANTHKVCVASRDSIDTAAYALNIVCGVTNCTRINEGGDRWYPNTVFAHADFAFNEYYQAHKKDGAKACDYAQCGAGVLVDCLNSGGRCQAKEEATDAQLTGNLGYLCNGPNAALGALCEAIQVNGTHYKPNTLRAHTNWAMNKYYQTYRCAQPKESCDFAGTGEIVGL